MSETQAKDSEGACLTAAEGISPADFLADDRVQAAVQQTMREVAGSGSFDIRLVGRSEMQSLNRRYANKDQSTNVLAFPSEANARTQFAHLGDVVICVPVVRDEAARQRKSLEAHATHMVVHGLLHLLGFDHMEEGDAESMENHETRILGALGLPDPYLVQASSKR